MENAEEILQCLDEFSKRRPKNIPSELEDYLSFVARTGDPVYQWPLIKCLFKEKLLNVITDFHETSPGVDIPHCPNVDPFNYDLMKNSLLERIDAFTAAPFTVQRICELLTMPRKQYNRIDKFMRAVEKNILVVSTREPGPQRHSESENGEQPDSMVNGSDSNSEYNVDVEMEDMSTLKNNEGAANSPQPSSSDAEVTLNGSAETLVASALSAVVAPVDSTPIVLATVSIPASDEDKEATPVDPMPSVSIDTFQQQSNIPQITIQYVDDKDIKDSQVENITEVATKSVENITEETVPLVIDHPNKSITIVASETSVTPNEDSMVIDRPEEKEVNMEEETVVDSSTIDEPVVNERDNISPERGDDEPMKSEKKEETENVSSSIKSSDSDSSASTERIVKAEEKNQKTPEVASALQTVEDKTIPELVISSEESSSSNSSDNNDGNSNTSSNGSNDAINKSPSTKETAAESIALALVDENTTDEMELKVAPVETNDEDQVSCSDISKVVDEKSSESTSDSSSEAVSLVDVITSEMESSDKKKDAILNESIVIPLETSDGSEKISTSLEENAVLVDIEETAVLVDMGETASLVNDSTISEAEQS